MRVEPTTVTLKTGERVDVRSPEAIDAPALLAYIRRLTSEFPRELNHPPAYWDSFSVSSEAAFLQGALDHPRCFLATAWHDGAPIGSAGIHAPPSTFGAHTAELGIGCLRAWQGKGLASALMGVVQREAVRAGAWNLWLRVRTFNAAGIALYEKTGWKRVGTLLEVASFEDGTTADEHVYQWRGDRSGVMNRA